MFKEFTGSESTVRRLLSFLGFAHMSTEKIGLRKVWWDGITNEGKANVLRGLYGQAKSFST